MQSCVVTKCQMLLGPESETDSGKSGIVHREMVRRPELRREVWPTVVSTIDLVVGSLLYEASCSHDTWLRALCKTIATQILYIDVAIPSPRPAASDSER